MLDSYVGTYRLSEKMLLNVFRKDNALFTQATGQGIIPIFAHAPNEFFTRMINASISFTRDGDGVVTGMVLHQNGDHIAPKVAVSDVPSSK